MDQEERVAKVVKTCACKIKIKNRDLKIKNVCRRVIGVSADRLIEGSLELCIITDIIIVLIIVMFKNSEELRDQLEMVGAHQL